MVDSEMPELQNLLPVSQTAYSGGLDHASLSYFVHSLIYTCAILIIYTNTTIISFPPPHPSLTCNNFLSIFFSVYVIRRKMHISYSYFLILILHCFGFFLFVLFLLMTIN